MFLHGPPSDSTTAEQITPSNYIRDTAVTPCRDGQVTADDHSPWMHTRTEATEARGRPANRHPRSVLRRRSGIGRARPRPSSWIRHEAFSFTSPPCYSRCTGRVSREGTRTTTHLVQAQLAFQMCECLRRCVDVQHSVSGGSIKGLGWLSKRSGQTGRPPGIRHSQPMHGGVGLCDDDLNTPCAGSGTSCQG